jgi:hypothetical protein
VLDCIYILPRKERDLADRLLFAKPGLDTSIIPHLEVRGLSKGPSPYMRQTSHRLSQLHEQQPLNSVLVFYIKPPSFWLFELEALVTGPVGCTLLHSRAPLFPALQSAELLGRVLSTLTADIYLRRDL